jgi:hypothetical protein
MHMRLAALFYAEAAYLSCSSVGTSLSPESHITEGIDAEANGVQGSDSAGTPGSQAKGTHLQPKLLGIVTSQRDRFRAR